MRAMSKARRPERANVGTESRASDHCRLDSSEVGSVD